MCMPPMSCTGQIVTLSARDYDAVLFDLDGVLTKTAQVHSAAWKQLFDAFLEQRAARDGTAFVSFDSAKQHRCGLDATKAAAMPLRQAFNRSTRAGARLDGGALPGPYLLGRALHIPAYVDSIRVVESVGKSLALQRISVSTSC